MSAREDFDVELKRRVMNMSRTELIHLLQLCEVTNIETDDPLCRLHHRKLCDLVSSNAVPSVMLCLAQCSACEIPGRNIGISIERSIWLAS
jgi:hypothetical protein